MKEVKEVKEYQIRKGLPELSKTKGKILAIKEGTVSEFIQNPDKWQGDINGKAISLTIKSEDTGRTFEQLITLPEGDIISDRSNLAKFIAMNGRTPKVGMDVALIVKNGYEKLFL